MTQLREHWEGVSLPGDYLLERWLSGDEGAGFFETSLGSDGGRALVKLVPEPAVDAAAQLTLWQRTRLLRHPNLRELLDCGRAELAGETVLYAVFEPADDTLAAALSHSALSEEEARDVLAAVLEALSYLQAQGLAHPALDPDHVAAVGDRIKLSTDALRAEAADTPYAEELRAFWDKISPCAPARSAEILAQALGAGSQTGLTPALASAPAPAMVAIPPTADVAVRPAVPDAAPAEAPETASAEVPVAAPRVPLASEFAAPPPNRFPRWILIGAAGVVLLILGLHFRQAPDAPVETGPAASGSAPIVAAPPAPAAGPAADTKSKPAAKAASTQPAAMPTAQAASKPAAPPASKPAAPAAPADNAVWRVIAFTYRSHDAAARKADQVNQRHPDLSAAVFSPKQRVGYYLVALGGRMTREDAVRLQKKARAAGLAPDVYVQNYLE